MPADFVVKNGSKTCVRTLGYATAGVGNTHGDVPPGCEVIVPEAELRTQRRIRGLDSNCPPAGHCIPGVHHEIHDHLLDLSGIDSCFSNLRIQRDIEDEVLTDDAAQQFVEFADHIVQIHHGR